MCNGLGETQLNPQGTVPVILHFDFVSSAPCNISVEFRSETEARAGRKFLTVWSILRPKFFCGFFKLLRLEIFIQGASKVCSKISK